MRIENVLKEVLSTIKPTEKEQKKLREIVSTITRKVKLPNAKAILGGSGAKNTWIAGTHDIDIYILFDRKHYAKKTNQLSDILQARLKKAKLPHMRLHGSRDYFQLRYQNFTIELVPIIEIKKAGQELNITDFSPLHVQYVKKHKKYADDIRLMKAFCRAQKVYGAESYIRGLSGYGVELLVIKYRGFLPALKAITKWKSPVIIGSRKDASHLNPSKVESPLILIDPVWKERNAAAALSQEKFDLIIKASKAFLAHPSSAFFTPKSIDIDQLKKKGKLVIFEAIPKSQKPDVAGAKCNKALAYILTQLKEKGFFVKFADSIITHIGRLFVVIDPAPLTPSMTRIGPSLKHQEGCKAFKKAHPSARVEKGHLMVELKRPYRTIEEFLPILLKDKALLQHVKSISCRQ